MDKNHLSGTAGKTAARSKKEPAMALAKPKFNFRGRLTRLP